MLNAPELGIAMLSVCLFLGLYLGEWIIGDGDKSRYGVAGRGGAWPGTARQGKVFSF